MQVPRGQEGLCNLRGEAQVGSSAGSGSCQCWGGDRLFAWRVEVAQGLGF